MPPLLDGADASAAVLLAWHRRGAVAVVGGAWPGATGGAEDAAVRQQERVPGGGRHAGRHAAGEDRRRAANSARRATVPEVRDRLTRPTPAPPRRSPSTAWCASTTCAPTPSRATSRSTWSTSSTAASRATPSRNACARALERRSARATAPTSRWSRCRPDRRCWRRSWPRSTAPTRAGSPGAAWRRARCGFGQTPDIVGHRHSSRSAPRAHLHVVAASAPSAGHSGGGHRPDPGRPRCPAAMRPGCTTAANTRCRCGCSCRWRT